MKVAILQELKLYSFNQLNELFHQSDTSTQDIINSLSISNIVRKVNTDTSIFELEELFNIDAIVETHSNNEVYVFKYVGMILVENICLVIYPKYLTNFENDKCEGYINFRQIISVIRKYNYKEQNIAGTHQSISNLNFLSTALELLEDYYQNGLYSNDQETVELNGDGEILWNKTINETSAYYSGHTPYYLDVFSSRQTVDTNDYFRRLHSAIITDLSRNLKDVLSVLGIEGIYLTIERLEDFGNIEYIINKINREQTIQFISKRQRVLKLLKKYLLEQDSYNTDNRISFLGTSNFNLVWEDVCSVVFGNHLKKPLVELGLTYSKNKKDSALLSDVIPKPIWKTYPDGVKHIARNTLKPDIVVVEEQYLSIYDAKYYKIILNKDKLSNYPGVNDVAKQFLYEMSFSKFMSENNLNLKDNTFLFPTDDDELKRLGEVSLDIFDDISGIKSNKIKISLIPAHKMYSIYLNKK